MHPLHSWCGVRRGAFVIPNLFVSFINQDCIPDCVQAGLSNRLPQLLNLALLFVI